MTGIDPLVLDVLTRDELRAEFARLPEPTTQSLVGRWDGTLVGTPSVVRRSRGAAALTPFHDWCGKEFTDAHHVVNLVRRGGMVRRSLAGDVVLGSSRLDGRPAAVVVYRHTARGPWRLFRGELRLMPDGDLLGMLMMPVGRLMIGPFPYRLTRG